MKVPNFVRYQAIAIGFAAALFFVSSAPAQEITNAEWSDRPGATAPLQASPELTANAAAPAAPSQTVTAAPTASKPTTPEAAVAQPASGIGTIAISMIGVAGVALFAWAQTKRANRSSDPRAGHAEESISLS